MTGNCFMTAGSVPHPKQHTDIGNTGNKNCAFAVLLQNAKQQPHYLAKCG